MTTATSTKESIKDSANWRDAVVDLKDYRTANKMGLSSGEFAADIRTHRKDLLFSVLNLGEYLRDLYYNGQITFTDDNGDDVQYIQVARTTVGSGRTPAGKTVFVYHTDGAEAQTHDFEVDIPNPGKPASTSTSPIKPKGGYPTAVAGDGDGDSDGDGLTSGDKLGSVAQAAGLGKNEYAVSIHSDKRLCVTRLVFDKFIASNGTPLRGGDPVWIVIDGDEARVTIEEPDVTGAKKYDLSTERGRVLFVHPTSPFDPGDHYKVTVTKEALVIDLSAPLD